MARPPIEDAETGRIAGFGAGMVAGAQIGTAVIPIPLIGTITGALVGGALGSRLGQRIAPTLIGTFNQLVTPPPPGEAELVMSTPSNAILITEEPPEERSETQLEQLVQLHAQGVLTDEEFGAASARLQQ